MRDWIGEFAQWSDEVSFLATRFETLAARLEGFLDQYVLTDRARTEVMIRRFGDVLSRCDELSYDEAGFAEAYATVHFLDRYYRFQRLGYHLLVQGALPLDSRGVRVLDVGTGPGPALFALSDIYEAVRTFGEHRSISDLATLTYELDYAERSEGFRQWLHHFVEHVHAASPDSWPIPFHHGSFYDFGELPFDETKGYWEYDDDGDLGWNPWTQHHRFNLVVLSNFLTSEALVEMFEGDLRRTMRFLRNRGLLLVVGARPKSLKYRSIYERVGEVLTNGRYGNWKYVAHCHRCADLTFDDHYSLDDEPGRRVTGIWAHVLRRATAVGVSDATVASVPSSLTAAIKGGGERQLAWHVETFGKRSRLRRRAR